MDEEKTNRGARPAVPRMRADAHRNVQTVLRAALEVFGTHGVDAPVREIAAKAGVGVGTLYRHFPQRADLIAAVFRSEVDACAVAGAELAARHSPWDALARWVERYTEFMVVNRGLAAALNSDDPAFDGLSDYFLGQLRPVVGFLLTTGVSAGEIRPDLDADDVLYAVAGLCTSPACSVPPDAKRLVGFFLDGLKSTAGPASR